jgi:hypothetical protein
MSQSAVAFRSSSQAGCKLKRLGRTVPLNDHRKASSRIRVEEQHLILREGVTHHRRNT